MAYAVLAAQSLVWFGFQQSHSKDVNEQYFTGCHVFPLQEDYIYLRPSLFDSPAAAHIVWGSCCGRKLQTSYAWLMVTNKQVLVKITVRSALFIFSPPLFWRCISCDVEHWRIWTKRWRWEKVAPSLCRLWCQRFATLLWPQLLSKWQTVWQSQVVGNLSWRPLKQVAPGPLPAGQWQTDLGQATLCPRPCSPLLSTPLLTTPRSLLLLWAALLATDRPCTLIVFSIQMRRTGRFCWVSLISLSFNTVSRCKTVTLLPFDPLTSFIGHHSSSAQNLKGWKVNISLFHTSAQRPTWIQPQMFLAPWKQHIKE